MSLPYTPNEIRACFDQGAWKRGTDYYLKDLVLKFGHNVSGNSVYGSVKGSGHQPYNVHAQIDGKTDVHAVCSCPVRINCKHAVALLLTVWFQEVDLDGEAASLQGSTNNEIENWLGELEKQLSPGVFDTANDVDVNTPNRLLYVLELDKASGDQLYVKYSNARKLKAGGYGKETRYDPDRIMNQGRASFVSSDDEAILREVYVRKMMDYIDYSKLSESGGGDLLLKMLATGRCFWLNKDGTPLRLGASIKGNMHWRTFDDATQQLSFVTDDETAIILPTIPPFYLNELTHECGPLEIDVPKKALSLMQKAPRVSMEELSSVTERLAQVIENIPTPASIKIKNKSGIKPIPYLHFCLFEPERKNFNPYLYGYEFKPKPVVEIKMDYDGNKTSLFEKGVELSYQQDDQFVKLKRDLQAEKKCFDQIEKIPLTQFKKIERTESVPVDLFSLAHPDYVREEDAWNSFMMENLPALEAKGWQVSYDDDFPYYISQVDEWHMEVDDNSDSQWFDLDLGIMVNGERYNLIHLISVLIKQNPRMFKDIQEKNATPPENIIVRISDGGKLAIPYERIERILNVLLELFDKKTDVSSKIRLPKWRAAELNELQSQGLQWQGNESLKLSADRLSKFKRIKPKAAPKKFKANLRDYQKEGLAWLQFLREYNFNGILADDMGLGKTVQALAHISVEKAAGRLDKPVLVIAPTSLMYNWRHEAEQFSPHLKLLTLHGPDRKKDFDRIAEHDIVLSTYPLLGRDDKVLLEQEWHLLILDEAQNIKNPKAKATKVVCQINARHRLCLTGTPLENHLGELWSIFNFLMPGLLGDEKQFRRIFRTPIEKQGDSERAKRLAKRLAPFMLRRKKDEVVKELPAKTEIVRSVSLEGVQRDLYETIRISMQKKVRDSIGKLGLNRSHIIVLDALLKLRQICCDPRLLKANAKAKKANSAKLELLMSLLPELLEEGRKILLFSQFTSMLSLIEDELKVLKIKYVKLTGSTRNREAPITAFQNGE
ncbi:MAG: DEAD/DEAH box helicase, partial [Gammaproteobacteria bacterium]|nr:DEAD/DEAH box helicase [Gammaproteobacteria bacterium]